MKTFFATTSKRIAIFAALFLLASVPSFAQPLNITSTEFEQAFSLYGATTSYNDASAAGLQMLVNQSGANQTWNFQGLPFVLDTTMSNINSTSVPYSASLPGADSFPTATQVEMSIIGGDTSYDFIQINQNGYYALGTSAESNGIAIVETKYTPPLEVIPFPLTYQTSWKSTSMVNEGRFSLTQSVDDSIDGWGTYVLPGNISAEALRLKEKITTSSSFGTSINYSFGWISTSAYSITIDADSNQNATDANYSVPAAPNIVLNNTSSSQYSISVGSNPVSSATNVSFMLPSDASVRISLMDPLGRVSQLLMNGMAHAGVNTLPLDPANLMNGTYFLRMESAGNSSMQKLIVNH